MSKDYFLGIDTSNYKTSVAVVDSEENVIADRRMFIKVQKGERGIRQSEALFQHINNLPLIMEEVSGILNTADKSACVKAVAVSSRPRPVKKSYMPVFLAGVSLGRSLAGIMKIPVYEFSHQEGHIAAAQSCTELKNCSRFIAFHFSGGTTEAVLVERSGVNSIDYKVVGGSRDISYGQLLDRIGVAGGLRFPCGCELDKIACDEKAEHTNIPKIKCRDGYVNLSGIETHCLRFMDRYNKDISSPQVRDMIFSVFKEISLSMGNITEFLARKYNVGDFLYAGGVSSSEFLRRHFKSEHNIYFAKPELSTDNAVGTALLGRQRYGA
mgnify:CR=1 FL=1